MAATPKQIRFEEDGFEDWSDSPSSPSRSPTPSVSSFQRDSRPKRGTTRIPARIVSKRALIHLGYSFAEDGDTIIVQLALGQNHIEELLELSKRIRSSDQGTSEIGDSGEAAPQVEDGGYDWINVNAPDTETPHLQTGEIKDFSGNEDRESTPDDTDWDWDDFEGPVIYSGVLNLNSTKSSMDNEMNSTAGKLLAWNQEKSDLINGAKTELNTVHAAEFYKDRAGNQKVTLACPEDYEFGATDESLVRLRWLHVQSESLNIATMETLISDCPYISQSLRLVALAVLKEVTAKCERSSENGSYLEPGSVIQYIGRYNSSFGVYEDEDATDTEPVVFVSSPHLLLTDKRPTKRFPGKHYMRSLREVLYGYDDETQSNNESRGRNHKLDEDEPPKLKVPQIWTLIVGADLIITFSELLSPEIQQNMIKIDRTKSSVGLYTVRLIDEQDMCRYHVVVKADWKYADFLKHAVALALKGQGPVNAAAYVLVNDYWGIITADIWLNLLASETIENYVFGIREKHEAQRRPNEEFLALSEKLLTAGSRSNLGSRRASRRRSDSRATNLNPIDMDMQIVLHPGMWEYGGDSPSPSEDGLDQVGSDTFETSTMSFDSHLGIDNSSLDGTVDLTTSMSEISFRMRNIANFESSVSLGGAEAPRLFKLKKETVESNQTSETTGSPRLQPGQSYAEVVEERRFILPRIHRQTTRPMSTRSLRSNLTSNVPVSRHRRSRNRSRTPSFTYARDSPLEAEPLPSWLTDQEQFRRTRSDASSFSGSWTRQTPDRGFGTSFPSTSLPPLSLGDLNFVPFLAWRLTWDDDKRSQSEIEKTLTQLLGNLNATIESDRIGKWYKASFECTKGELTQRLASMLQLSPPKPTGEATEGVAQTYSRPDVNPGSNPVGDANVQEPDLKNSTELGGSTGSLVAQASTLFGSTENEENELDPKVEPNTHFRQPVHSSSCEDLRSGNDPWKLMDSKEDHESFLLSRIFSVSQSMLSAFLPDEGRLVHHPVCKRFWGSVDAILRGLQWSIDEMKGTDQLSWFVTRPTTPFPPGESASISGSKALSDCDECDKVKGYLSPEEALDHWHKVHMRTPCLHQAKKGRVFDDPCFVWIRRHAVEESWTIRSKTAPRNEVVSCLELFCEELLDMVDRTEELHKLVMSVTSLGDSVDCHDSRPHLPNSLVEAFERIIGLFVLKAKEISWMNRLTVTPDSLYGRHAERRLMDLKRNAAAISERVRNHLDRAKEDIILLGTSRGDMDRIIIAPIGPEFLAIALISNLQNNISKQGTNEKVDLISHYRAHTARLRFNTNRKPKRQAFVEIHALEEELEALQMVVASQQGLLRAYQRLFSPLNFKHPMTDWIYYKERKSLFKLESKCVRRQQRRLAERDRALGVLRKKVRVLRDETKQRIEILDEGHGKAIRVFTIVTLFFLPLSFVTSFFGMNTTDIRDTDYDQKIFWISALPVTFGVIGLAFLYGYKWDMIAAWANGALRSADKSTAPHDFLIEEIPTWTSTAEPKDTWLPNHGRASVTGWRYRMSYLSARQRRRKGRVPRKKTDDSLFRP
ncbi:mg2+ transporter [Colletotrichum scovillei]|nr:mg2+ transporter [Colletotrichum scovillei]